MVRAVSAVQLLGDRYRVLETLRETPNERTLRVEDTHQENQTRVLWQRQVSFRQSELCDRAQQLCRQEFEFLQRLQHPQVPRFYDFWAQTVDAQLWLTVVREDIVGPTLRQWLQQRSEQTPWLSEREVTKFLLQVLNGVGYIHTQGVIHRHLSPDHLQLRAAEGRWVLVNFGGMSHALQLLQAEAVGDVTTQQTQDEDGEQPQYAPLEQVQKGILYTYSDIYAIAATAMYALTGQEPSAYRDPQTGAWDWSATPLACAELQAILARMLARKPGDRPQNVQSIIHLLRRIPREALSADENTTAAALESETLNTAPSNIPSDDTSTPLPLRQWAVRAVLGLLFVVGAGAIGWGVGQTVLHRQSSNPSPFPELELSPEVALAEDAEAKALDFPLVDDGEPDPDPSWSEEEQARRLSLRDQRRQLGIDYEFFRALVQYAYGQAYPAPSGVFLVVDGALERQQWDALAQRLLNQLAGLSDDARRRLGRYEQPIKLGATEIQQRQVTPVLFEALVAAHFETYFPDQSPDSPPLKQLWRAIAFDQLNHLRQSQPIEELSLTPGSTEITQAEQLAAGQGKIYTLSLESDQLLTTNLVGESTTILTVQTPSGELLLELGRDRFWSGRTIESGDHRLVILNTATEPADFQLYLTME
ncbi:MAG: protein kinase [Spirulina sp. SIO3F2]|nr:protein kinase [Spirulina sp. SIO3F2]